MAMREQQKAAAAAARALLKAQATREKRAPAAAAGGAPAAAAGGAPAAAMGEGPAAPPQRTLGRAVEQNGEDGSSVGAASSTTGVPCLNHGCYLNVQILQHEAVIREDRTGKASLSCSKGAKGGKKV